MKNESDKLVQGLIDEVQDLKNQIAKAERPKWETHCSFSYNRDGSGARINLQVEKNIEVLAEVLGFLIGRKKDLEEGCKKLGIKSKFNWMNYSFEQWEEDITSRISKITIDDRKALLAKMEEKLDTLVSPEMKRELELKALQEEIARLKGN